jgi:hypothetical protein
MKRPLQILSGELIGEYIPLSAVPAESVYRNQGFTELSVIDPQKAPIYLGLVSEKIPGVENEDNITATRRGRAHKRSFQIGNSDSTPLLQDNDVTLKGADWSDPKLFRHGFRAKKRSEYFGGLQLEDAETATEAGIWLRSLGIYGEEIGSIQKLKFLPIDGHLVPVRAAVDILIREADLCFRGGALRRFYAKKPGLTPVVVTRRVPCDVRLNDLTDTTLAHAKTAMMQKSMDRLSRRVGSPNDLSADKPSDRLEHFGVRLPFAYGFQMGTLNGNGGYQKYPHTGNVAADGGLVDLDSIVSSKRKADRDIKEQTASKFISTSRLILRNNEVLEAAAGDPITENYHKGYKAGLKA